MHYSTISVERRIPNPVLEIYVSGKFRKDLKRALRRGKDEAKIRTLITTLVQQEPLEARYQDHILSGNYEGCRDCHIEPDWLLIYEIIEETETLHLVRTGSHSDLFS